MTLRLFADTEITMVKRFEARSGSALLEPWLDPDTM
jgi:hypothetical protein